MEFGTQTTRTRFQALAVAAVLGFGVVGGTATMAARADAAPASASVPAADPAKDAVAMHKSFVALWNEQRFDEMLDFYAEDAIAAPPNHDLIRGNTAIVAYYKSLRPLLGEFQTGHEPHSVVKSEDVTAILGNYVLTNGVRFTANEVYKRQADGRYKLMLDQVGLRDPLT